MMKIESVLTIAALSLAAQVACAKPHPKGADGDALPGSFAELSGNHHENNGLALGHFKIHGNDESKHDWVSSPTAPVPEPETYALMLAGLVVVSLVARRRAR
jgi:hypothetical protein